MIRKTLIYWIPLATTIILLSGLAFGLVQQTIRLSANNPQIQIAEDSASYLAVTGHNPQSVLNQFSSTVNIAQSLNTFIIIYNQNGNIIGSNARLNGQIPTIPASLLTQVKQSKEVRVTWQLESDVRDAIVIDGINDGVQGYVVVGRSIREVEKLENIILRDAMIGGIFTLLMSFIVTVCTIAILDKQH